MLAALNEARVETLLSRASFRAAGARDPTPACCATPGRAERRREPVEDIVEQAIEKAIEQSAEVMVVRHHDDLGPLGGIGAVLRY